MQRTSLRGFPLSIPSLEKGGSDRRVRSKRQSGEGSSHRAWHGSLSSPVHGGGAREASGGGIATCNTSRVKGVPCYPTSPLWGGRSAVAKRGASGGGNADACSEQERGNNAGPPPRALLRRNPRAHAAAGGE